MSKPSVQIHEGQCGSWWKSLSHFDYLHRCTLDKGHPADVPCRCECGMYPGPRGVRFPKRISDMP